MGKFIKITMFFVVALYMWSLYVYISTPIRTEFVKMGDLEDYQNVLGIIIRNEELIHSNVAGSFTPSVQEGERVAKNATIATVYKEHVDATIQARIAELNQRITSIEARQSGNVLFARDLEILDRQIQSRIRDIIQVSYSGNVQYLASLKADINNILDKRAIITGQRGASGYTIEELQKEKEKYENQLRASKMDLTAEKSGIVSYHIDNLEEILNPTQIHQFTPNDFKVLKDMNQDIKQDLSNIKPGQAVAKIIDNFEWYIGFILNTNKSYDFKIGDSVGVRFNNVADTMVNARVHYISQTQDNHVLIVVALNRHIPLAYQQRLADVDIIKHSYAGFIIPTDAIRVRNGRTGVFVIRESIARFSEVDVIHNNNDFAIVKENNLRQNGILLYDEVIIKGTNIEEGKLMR